MTLSMSGKVAIVTGGSSGIGRATAIKLAGAGAHVAIVSRTAERGQQVVDAIKASDGQATYFKADVGSAIEIEKLIKSVVDRLGGLHIAVNNAAAPPSEIGPLLPITEIAVEHWDRLMDVNLRGVWLGMKFQIPAMIRCGGGAIVNVSSMAGGKAIRGMGHYVASKFGLNGLTRVAAAEFATSGVRINSVLPGPVDSPIVNEMEALRPGYKKAITDVIPMQRMGLDDEVANLIVWLCSDQASYVTGTNIPVDGGFLA